MNNNFDRALDWVLTHEGGFVDHPDDPGGATNMGITHRTYSAWLKRMGRPNASVEDISDAEVAAIYRVQYWDAVRAYEMPSGLDYALFDFAVNSGPARAIQFLQRIVGVEDDGVIGTQTMAAVDTHVAVYGVPLLVHQLCMDRLNWLRRLSHWGTFRRGWTRRVNDVERRATAMARDIPPFVDVTEPQPAPRPIARLSTPSQTADNAGGLVATLVGGGGVAGLLTGDTGPVLEGAVAFAVVASVLFLLWRQWKVEA